MKLNKKDIWLKMHEWQNRLRQDPLLPLLLASEIRKDLHGSFVRNNK